MANKKRAGVDVFPVFVGMNVQFVPGTPAVPRLGISRKEADELIATGAFSEDKPTAKQLATLGPLEPPGPEPPEPESPTPTEPAEQAGSSDS